MDSQCADTNNCTVDTCAAGTCVHDSTTRSGFPCTLTVANDGICTAAGNSISCLLKNGQACGTDGGTPCSSGHCVGGLCCNSPCTGSCQRCNAAGTEGTCLPFSSICTGNCSVCGTSGNCEANAGVCNGNCSVCAGGGTAFYCTASAPLCTGTCNVCSGSGTTFNCAADATRCTGNCSTCTGAGTAFNCVASPGSCSGNCSSCTGSGNAFNCGAVNTCGTCSVCSGSSTTFNCAADAPGYPCTGGVCSGGGVCNACTVGAVCTTNPNASYCKNGTMGCSTGVAVCADGSNKNAGSPCVGGLCTSAGVCSPYLYASVHSQADCTAAGGAVASDGTNTFCRFTGATCAGGWTPFLTWSTTTAASSPYVSAQANGAQAGSCCGAPVCKLNTLPCTTGQHAWSNAAVETASCAGVIGAQGAQIGTCNQCSPIGVLCTGSTSTSATATVTEVGCY